MLLVLLLLLLLNGFTRENSFGSTEMSVVRNTKCVCVCTWIQESKDLNENILRPLTGTRAYDFLNISPVCYLSATGNLMRRV